MVVGLGALGAEVTDRVPAVGRGLGAVDPVGLAGGVLDDGAVLKENKISYKNSHKIERFMDNSGPASQH